MKIITLSCLAALALLALPSCKTEERNPSVSTTTTTEESMVRTAPVRDTTTTETHTLRSY